MLLSFGQEGWGRYHPSSQLVQKHMGEVNPGTPPARAFRPKAHSSLNIYSPQEMPSCSVLPNLPLTPNSTAT